MTPGYAVQLKPSVDRRLQKLPVDVQRRMVGEMAALAFDPRPVGVVKLVGADNLWRVRVGDYRIVYEVDDKRGLVTVLRVAHRKDIYRGR
jgi:mRNA interferase RelE/StbE